MHDKYTQNDGRIRVALIHYRDDAAVGGSLRVGQLLGNHLDRDRIDPHFIFSYGGPGPVTATSRIPVHFVGSNGPSDFSGWLRIRRLIRDLQPNVLHFLNPVFWANIALWDWRGPRINHLHGPLPERIRGVRNRLVFGAFRASMTMQVSVSKDVEHEALRVGAARSNSLSTIYNAVECSKYQNLPSSSEARDQLDLPKDAYLLGMICRLAPEKGCQDGIRLLKYLPADCHLVICGAGPLAGELRRGVAANGLEARVHFLGLRDSVQLVYAAIDNLLFLSKTEPFGLLIAEAMASGVPVVGIAGEGGYSDPEYPLVTRDNALLLRPDKVLSRNEAVPDPLLRSLAEAVIRLRNSPETRNSMAERAQRWVEERFDIKGQAGEMADLYDSLVPAEKPLH
jgi:glycosyltransferase involved in cell wall biosynthesis